MPLIYRTIQHGGQILTLYPRSFAIKTGLSKFLEDFHSQITFKAADGVLLYFNKL